MIALTIIFFTAAFGFTLTGILALTGKISHPKIRSSGTWLILSGTLTAISGFISLSKSPQALIYISSAALIINLILCLPKNED